MPKIAVGLFRTPNFANRVVNDLKGDGFARQDLRVLGEPVAMAASGMDIPRTEFELDLFRELMSVGATEPEAEGYLQGVRRGGVLVLASGTDEKVDAAAEVMNRHEAVRVEEIAKESAPEHYLHRAGGEDMTPVHDAPVQSGRDLAPGGGARVFVW